MLLVSLFSSGTTKISYSFKSVVTVGTQILGVKRVFPFLGKVHEWMHATRKRIEPHSVSSTAMVRYSDKQISAISAMNIMKRDSLILLVFCA